VLFKVLRDLFKIKGMAPLVAVVRSRLGIAIALLALFIFSLTEIDRHKINRIEQMVHAQERVLMRGEAELFRHESKVIQQESALISKGLGLRSVVGKNNSNSVKSGQTKVDPLSPYRSVDSGAKGRQICICPIDRIVYLGMQTCSSGCPRCHRHLKRAVYGGEGRIGQQNASALVAPQERIGNGLKALVKQPLLPKVKI
jgi:hypothetical protein